MAPLKGTAAFGLLPLALLISVIASSSASAEEAKTGRCPPVHRCISNATSSSNSAELSTCSFDPDCQGTLKCCPSGCDNVKLCQHPVFSACEHARRLAEKRTRALLREDPGVWLEGARVPTCREDGRFEPVQCGHRGECWCVDGAGYEIGGTRVAPGNPVNCTAPRNCAGPTCRMLCPYDFELDEAGCPLCRCRDPCAGVRCPGSLQCQLEEVVCEQEPCPPVPDCKSPRSLSDACPIGEPLSAGIRGKPFVCGDGPDSPKCPPYFSCSVDSGREYGVCCPSVDSLVKPGTCPNETQAGGFACDGTPCKHDMQCEGLKKCCSSSSCPSARCVPMAESTKCLQQKILAELLSTREDDAMPSYVPQCTSSGDFEERQCSRNGRVCWCVDGEGDPVPRTVGDSRTVHCDGYSSNEAVEPRGDHHSHPVCRTVVCNEECPLGFLDDADGCPTCRCKDPCQDLECANGTICEVIPDRSCSSDQEHCPPVTICRAKAITLRTKPGTCPTTAAAAACGNETCQHDLDCGEGHLKCCSTPRCPNTCVEPMEGTDLHRPAMCEYLRTFAQLTAEQSTFPSTITEVSCYPDGRFNVTQCDKVSGVCWCVDEFGAEVVGSNVTGSSGQKLDCLKVLGERKDDDLLCRLDCDYGLMTNERGGRICECRDPCQNSRCSNRTRCQMVFVNCRQGFCPPVPQCVPVPTQKTGEVNDTGNGCPVGKPLEDTLARVPVDCVTWASSGPGSCPPTHFCLMVDGKDTGHCCPQPAHEDKRVKPGSCPQRVHGGPRPACSRDMKWDECDFDSDCQSNFKCCPNECGVRSCHRPLDVKAGQCPLQIGWEKTNGSSCDPQCNSDADCADDAKCCYNGCSLSCVKAELKTGCAHRLDAASRLSGSLSVPRCHVTDGAFEKVQCDALTGVCWCVDDAGRRVPGTPPNCTASVDCPERLCENVCGIDSSSYLLDAGGCPTCECRDECEGVDCADQRLECRAVHVNCVDEPCPPIPICIPSPKNPCEFGELLRDESSGAVKTCTQGCPSTHRCQFSATGDFSACCPKSKEVCSLKEDYGSCSGLEVRWHFDLESNGCVKFNFSGCAGNLNNFAAKEDCERVCPARSKCERLRDAALRRNGVSRFLPKCKSDGSWEILQCIPEVGICWCSNPAGAYIEGTAIRGVPKCPQSSRSARKLDLDQNVIGQHHEQPRLCQEGTEVHLCPADLCDGKVCLSHPEASCRVDPCGGCNFAFYSGSSKVNCSKGLSQCQERVQRTLNSPAWHRQALTDKDTGLMSLAAPNCAPDGSYETLQTHGQMSWCVDSSGRPATCNGSYVAVLPICSDPEKVPKVCLDQCLEASCDAHPDAVCVADPCDECQVTFVSPTTGETLRCEDECLQPVEVGMCKGAIAAWYFDHEDGSCKKFLYGGCQGNDNRFDTREQCVARCENPADICSLPNRTGMCRASMKRWFFEKKSRSCKPFIFGGCDGNANNFETKEECEARCPDVVLCNRMEFGQGPKVCIRSQVCANSTCAGDQFAVCTADPCTLEPYFVDTDGKRISCDADSSSTTEIDETDLDTEVPATTIKPNTVCRKRLVRLIAANSSSDVPVCDEDGEFKPTQCDTVSKVCWCVDEAGQRVLGSGQFPEGLRECAKERVKSVAVHLSFGHDDPDTVHRQRTLVRNAVLALLMEIAVPEDGIENDVSVEVSAKSVEVRFTLVGEHRLDAASSLEDKIATGTSMSLKLSGGLVLRLDRTASTVFHYARDSDDSSAVDDGQATSTEAAIYMSITVAVIVLIMVILVLVHRRRSRGYFPSGGSEVSSVILTPSFSSETSTDALENNAELGMGNRQYESLYVTGAGDRWQTKA